MITRPFGRTGIDVAVIGQGTWQLRDPKAAAETLAEGLRLGMTHIDTAELYRGSEEVIRPVIAGRRDEAAASGASEDQAAREARGEVFLVSKVLPRNASYKGTLEACEKSLQRLGTDHLDVYLQHWNDGTHPISETMRAMAELVDKGKTRFVGVSNFDVEELEEAKAALGKHRLVCDQVLYHLGARGIESEVLPWCKRNGLAVVGYSPFGSTGGFPKPASKGGRVLEAIAKARGLTPRQVALAFLTRDEACFTIPKAESLAHVRENAGGAVKLAPEDVAAIDEAFPMKPGLSFL